MRWLAWMVCVVAMATSCKARSSGFDPPPANAPARSARPTPGIPAVDDPLAAIPELPPELAALLDARSSSPPAAPPEVPVVAPIEERLQSYAELLAIDFTVYQIVAAFPGAPAGTTFATHDYKWRVGDGSAFEDLTREVGEIADSAAAAGSAAMPVDLVVGSYAHALAEWLPALADLHAYYDDQRFVDDEFARARREQPELAKHAAALARLRAPMRAAVADAWRTVVAGHPASPRGVIDHAWQACMAVADQAMSDARDDALAAAVSKCRKSIQPITDLGANTDFADDVRKTAVELGDWVAQQHPVWNPEPSRALATLTDEYDQLWPSLPADPPEKP